MSQVASHISTDSSLDPAPQNAPPMAAPVNRVSNRTVFADFLEPTQDFPQGRLAFRYQPNPDGPIYDSPVYDASTYIKVTTDRKVNIARAIDAANRIQEQIDLNPNNPHFDLSKKWTRRLSREEAAAFSSGKIASMFA